LESEDLFIQEKAVQSITKILLDIPDQNADHVVTAFLAELFHSNSPTSKVGA
jgi:hypothetical protein